MKPYDYVVAFIVADVISASALQMNLFGMVLGIVNWALWEYLRRTNKI